MLRKLLVRPLLIVLVTAALAGAAREAQAVDLSGCWEGRWSSHCTPHQGPLKATFVRQDDTHYCVHFKGRFFKLLPFKYSVMLEVVEETPEGVTLQGSHYLGRLFGTFTYTATATDCSFNANYSSCKDQGVFCLKKVANFCSCCCD